MSSRTRSQTVGLQDQPESVPLKTSRKSERPDEGKIPRRAVLRFDDIGIEVFKFFDRDTLCSMQFLGRAFRDFIDGLPNAALYTVPELRVIDDKYGGFEIRLSKEDGLGQFARFKLSRARDRLRHIWAASVSISTYDFRMTAKQFAIVCDVVRQVRPPDLHFVELDLAHSAYKKFAQIFANGFVKRIAFEQCTMSKKFDADSFVRMCARNGVLFIDFSASCLSDNDGEKAIAVTEDVILDFCFGREDISSREAVGLHVNLKENSSTFLRTFLDKWNAPNISRHLDCWFPKAAKQQDLHAYKAFKKRTGDDIFFTFKPEELGMPHDVYSSKFIVIHAQLKNASNSEHF